MKDFFNFIDNMNPTDLMINVVFTCLFAIIILYIVMLLLTKYHEWNDLRNYKRINGESKNKR